MAETPFEPPARTLPDGRPRCHVIDPAGTRDGRRPLRHQCLNAATTSERIPAEPCCCGDPTCDRGWPEGELPLCGGPHRFPKESE